MCTLFFYATLTLLCLAAAPVRAAVANQLVFHWVDDFKVEDRERLQIWIERTDTALNELVGSPPYTRHIYFYRVDDAREPVPWAHTRRGRELAVHLYVDPAFSTDKFLRDWTAGHELSHLLFPYLGSRYAWVAEGFASYMQYQVLAQLGMVARDDLNQIYRDRFDRAAARFNQHDLPFADAADALRRQRDFPTMYWGGAVFFWQAELALQSYADSNLVTTLNSFLQCCRRRTRSVSALLRALDEIAGEDIFVTLMQVFRSRPGFPEYEKELPLGLRGRPDQQS